jgi:hypothetical protein
MLGRHPRPDVCGTVLQHNTPAGFVLSQDTDSVTIREHQIGKIQHKDTAGRLCIDDLAQLIYIARIKLTADRKHNVSATGTMNSQHRPSLRTQVPGHSEGPRTHGYLADVMRRDFGSGEIRDNTNFQERFGTRARKRLLLIPNARILDSSVERGIPSFAAAPEDPNTRPPVARSASSMSAFSCEASVLEIPSRLSAAV